MFRTFIKMLTPFIMSITDIVNGVMFCLCLLKDIPFNTQLNTTLSHLTGSSVLVVFYIIVNSKNMCKYYKTACYFLLVKHIFSLIYLYTDISSLVYVYAIITFSVLSLVFWTASLLGLKTYKTMSQACKHSEIK